MCVNSCSDSGEWEPSPELCVSKDPLHNPRGRPNSLLEKHKINTRMWFPLLTCTYSPAVLLMASLDTDGGRINPVSWRNAHLDSSPPLTTLNTPEQCDSGNNPTWKGPGCHSSVLGRFLWHPHFSQPLSAGISSIPSSQLMHLICFFFISDTITPLKGAGLSHSRAKI